MSPKGTEAKEEPAFKGKNLHRFVYGPVLSRRLGRSLGVDILPPKTCNLDCIYCQLGPTKKRVVTRRPYFRVKDVTEAIKAALNQFPEIDYITFSGSGEPTLNTNLGEIIAEIKNLTSIPVAVLTNSVLLSDKQVRRELLLADLVVPSLDSATQEGFLAVNRPSPEQRLQTVIESLAAFRTEYSGQIWLEIMLVKGVNDDLDQILKLKPAISIIKPDKIQLNTVVRPPAEPWALPLEAAELQAIQALLGPQTEIVTETRKRIPSLKTDDLAETILSTLRRRPASLAELTAMSGESSQRIQKTIESLLAQGKIVAKEHYHQRQYEIKSKREKNEGAR